MVLEICLELYDLIFYHTQPVDIEATFPEEEMKTTSLCCYKSNSHLFYTMVARESIWPWGVKMV